MSFFTAEIFSGLAVMFSAFSLWYTSFRNANLKLFIPPLIRYASPYQNSLFEVFEIPLTLINNGARTGTVLSLELAVTNTATGQMKRFYSAGLGSWSLGASRGEGIQSFTPLSLVGRSSHSATVLFYARTDSTVMQIVEGTGRYKFSLVPLIAERKDRVPLTFEMDLPFIDHRAFTTGTGTLALNHPDFQPSR